MDRSRSLEGDELDKFVGSLGSLRCAIPDELVRHYLARAGFKTDDVRLERLIALAAQKFLADVANDALAHSRLRGQATAQTTGRKRGPASSNLVLTVDDLERALREYGVPYRKPPYFADSPSAGAPAPAPAPSPAATGPSVAATTSGAASAPTSAPRTTGSGPTAGDRVGVSSSATAQHAQTNGKPKAPTAPTI